MLIFHDWELPTEFELMSVPKPTIEQGSRNEMNYRNIKTLFIRFFSKKSSGSDFYLAT